MNEVCSWITAHGSTCSEVLGSLLLAVNVYLVTRENIWNWPIAVLGSAFYIVVYRGAGLYSDVGLQVVYIVLSFYGWYHWLHGGANRDVLPVTRTGIREASLLVVAGIAGWAVLFNITRLLPGARLPMLDAALVATSLVAQWMMTRKLLESWAVWIAVDIVYVPTFIYRHLYLTAVLYAVFLALAVLGHVEWKRSSARASFALS